jgi:hypothetical protein
MSISTARLHAFATDVCPGRGPRAAERVGGGSPTGAILIRDDPPLQMPSMTTGMAPRMRAQRGGLEWRSLA